MNQDERWLLEEKYGGRENESFYANLERLRSGEPLAYVIGHAPFLNCKINLDSHPLIPRTETEYWVTKAIESIKAKGISEPKVLDLCAGSGCIGVAVAKEIKDAVVTFAEIDPAHLPTIKKNLEQNILNYSDRMEYLQAVESNLFENITGTFDVILTNPPYIDTILDRAESSVKSHEPHLALYGGQGGLDIIDQIVKKAPAYLNEGGELWIEHEPEQVKVIQSLAKQNSFVAVTHKDQYGIERFSLLTLGKTK